MFLLFLPGCNCYYIVLPACFDWLIESRKILHDSVIKIDDYLDFINMMLLGFGLIFEMPVIAAFLSMFGLISASFLWNKFRYSIVIIGHCCRRHLPNRRCLQSDDLVGSDDRCCTSVSVGVAAIFGWRRKKRGLVCTFAIYDLRENRQS